MRKLLIIGCGRSGTAFASILFKKLGLDIGHEKLGVDGMSSWYATAKKEEELRKNYQLILHQVRNPLETISSMQTAFNSSWKLIAESIPLDPRKDLVLRCAKYWYYWNLMAEKKSALTYRVENIFNILPEICAKLEIEYKDLRYLQKQRINTRKGKYQKISWEQIRKKDKKIHDLCLDLAKKYGYKF